MKQIIKVGQLVRKRCNPYVKYIVRSVKKHIAHLEPLNTVYVPTQTLLFPTGYPEEKLVKVPYNSLLLSRANYRRVKNYLSIGLIGTIYIDAHNKSVVNIERDLESCTIVKVYTSAKDSDFYFIKIEDITRVIASVDVNGKWKKLPSFKITFSAL